jgi:flagellar assembly factor FliW
MLKETTRFGQIEVDDDKLITFEQGLLGFTQYHTFALIQTTPDPVLYWLQSTEAPNLAFVVCDPRTFVPDYQVPIRRDEVRNLELRDADDVEVLVIVNRQGDQLTGNLLGPLVIGATSRKGRQFVLADRRWSTRAVLATVPATGQAALSA